MLLKEAKALSPEERVPFARDALLGLAAPQKWIPDKYLYDRRGFHLFERVCGSPHYYPFWAEQEILSAAAREISDALGSNVLLIEPGSGLSTRARVLIKALRAPAAYVNIEKSLEILLRATVNLQLEFPALSVFPVYEDYSQGIRLPAPISHYGDRRAVFLPGSAIGNFHPEEALVILRMLRGVAGANGLLLVGVDLKKDPSFFQAAYDDPAGVSSDFNLNLLTRMNRELEANFQVRNFAHCAIYREGEGCMETHIKSLIPQIVSVCGHTFSFREGETIHTKNSYKYSIREFGSLARGVGLDVEKFWLDSESLFAVFLLSVAL